MPTQLDDESRLESRHILPTSSIKSSEKPAETAISDRPKKDVWDKLTAIGPIISGLITLAVGGYFTYIFNEHQLRLLEVQTIEKFIPRLAGDEASKRTAILAISTLTSTELASKIAAIYASSGTASALESIAENGNEKDKQIASKALATTLEKIADSQTRITNMETVFKEDIQRADANKDTKPGELADKLDKLAETYLVEGQYALAEPLFHRSLVLRQQTFGNDSGEARKSLKALADLYRLKGDTRSYENYLNLAQSYEKKAGIAEVQKIEDRKEAAQQNADSAKAVETKATDTKAAEPAVSEAVIDKASSAEVKISEKKESTATPSSDNAPHPN